MVRVDVQIALGLNAEVDQTMLAEQVEHMVEEADPGRNAVGTGPVEVQGQGHVGFVCLARYGGLAGGGRHGLGPIEVGFAALLEQALEQGSNLRALRLWPARLTSLCSRLPEMRKFRSDE